MFVWNSAAPDITAPPLSLIWRFIDFDVRLPRCLRRNPAATEQHRPDSVDRG